jgi:hypothetical protein
MHFVWANESTADDEAMIYGTPDAVEQLNLELDNGILVDVKVPLIEIVRDGDSQGGLTDNLIASGVNGLLFSTRLRKLLEAGLSHSKIASGEHSFEVTTCTWPRAQSVTQS